MEEKSFTGQAKLEQNDENSDSKNLTTVQEKPFSHLESQHSGDCTMENMRIVFRSNGTGSFSARVRSTDDDDGWRHEFFGRSADGSELFRLGRWKKKMPDDDTWYDWSADFTYDVNHFDALAIVSWEYYC